MRRSMTVVACAVAAVCVSAALMFVPAAHAESQFTAVLQAQSVQWTLCDSDSYWQCSSYTVVVPACSGPYGGTTQWDCSGVIRQVHAPQYRLCTIGTGWGPYSTSTGTATYVTESCSYGG